MGKPFWRRRNILIGTVVVALSIGIVVSSIPYLPPTTPRHTSITTTRSYFISGGGNVDRPVYYPLTVYGISSVEAFWIGARVINGTAVFCVLSQNDYNTWYSAFNQYGSASARLANAGCLYGPTSEVSQDTLKFQTPYTGDWIILALNSGAKNILVQYSPA